MSYDFASLGYRDPVLIWEGILKNIQLVLYIWRREKEHSFTGCDFALDLRNKVTNITLKMKESQLLNLLAYILHDMHLQKEPEVLTRKSTLQLILQERYGP